MAEIAVSTEIDTIQLSATWYDFRKVRPDLALVSGMECGGRGGVVVMAATQLPKQLPTSQVNGKNNNVCTIKGKVYCL